VYWQDEAFRIPFTEQRVGLDAIAGFLLPGVGDLASAAASMTVVFSAVRQGVPVRVLLLMVLNILLDAAVGALPILGDLFDVSFKASSKNLRLLEQHGQSVPVRGATGRFARVLLLLVALALTLVFLSAMLSLILGFALAGIAW
jgi:hypothetical protein